MKSSFLFFTFFWVVFFGNAQTDTCLASLNLGISFPPVADSAQRDFAKIHLNNLNVKSIRFAEDWALREPAQGNFNWFPLDERINWAFTNGYEVLLTIQSNAPAWACSSVQNSQSCVFSDNNDFKTYIDLIMQRYTGKLKRIQFGNEWQSQFWYAGDAQEFIDANNILYQSVQTYSPNTKVILGGFTTISLRFLAGCNGYVSSFYDDDGNFYDANYLATNCNSSAIQDVKKRIDSVLEFAHYDMLDLHLYDDVEQWDEYFLNFSDTITKPIIVSEFGGPNMNYEPYSEVYQTERLFKYIKKLDSLNISDAYFFKLVEGTANPAHSTSGLITENTLIEKQAYSLFKAFNGCITSTSEIKANNKILFFPNPMSDYTTIQFVDSKPKELTIYGSDGKVIRTVRDITSTTYVIKREELQSGFYLVQITDESGVITIGKMVVE